MKYVDYVTTQEYFTAVRIDDNCTVEAARIPNLYFIVNKHDPEDFFVVRVKENGGSPKIGDYCIMHEEGRYPELYPKEQFERDYVRVDYFQPELENMD